VGIYDEERRHFMSIEVIGAIVAVAVVAGFIYMRTRDK